MLCLLLERQTWRWLLSLVWSVLLILMMQSKRNNSIYIFIFIQTYFWGSLSKIVAYLLGWGVEVIHMWVPLLVRQVYRRRKVTGTLTVQQGRKQCPEERREGYHCRRQNLWCRSKEMMAELCLEGHVSTDTLASGVRSWTPPLARSPAPHHSPLGIHSALVLPTSQARNLGLSFDSFFLMPLLQSIS